MHVGGCADWVHPDDIQGRHKTQAALWMRETAKLFQEQKKGVKAGENGIGTDKI